MSVTCTHKGCGKPFDPTSSDLSGCVYHPGAPVFHEGQKSWSCCKDVNKPVLSFDDFVAIPGCQTGDHTAEKPEKPAPAPAAPAPSASTGATEHYGGAPNATPVSVTTPTAQVTAPSAPVAPKSTEYIIEDDDATATISPGTSCKRKGCGKAYDPSTERHNEECTFHPGAPIFHEGSKGWSCCKRRVLEFDEFLRIEGCRKARHMFIGPAPGDKEELVDCRVDHYQTPTQVIVSIFGKGADKASSAVTFDATKMHVDLTLPANKRFKKTFDLFGPIDSEASSYRVLGTKCEVILAKADGRSWPSVTALEASASFVPQLAFSAGGGRGTVGAKEMVLDQTNKAMIGK